MNCEIWALFILLIFRSLRAASVEELSRRTREAESLSSALGSVAGRRSLGRRSLPASATSTSSRRSGTTPSQDAAQDSRGGRSGSSRSPTSLSLTRQRATAALCRLRSRTSRLNLRHLSTSPNSPTSRPGSSSATSPSTSRGSRGKLSRAHNQFVSQLRATFRAIEMSPDLARQKNNKISRSKAEASQVVMEQTEASRGNVIPEEENRGSSTRNELRALSQRLERMLRDRREAGEEPTSVPPNVSNNPDNDDEETITPEQREALLADLSTPRHESSDDAWRPSSVRERDNSPYERFARRISRRRHHSRPGRGSHRERSMDRFFLGESSSESDSESPPDPNGDVSLHDPSMDPLGQVAQVHRAGRWTRYDFPTPTTPDYPGPSGSLSAVSAAARRAVEVQRASRESWRASMRERLEIRAGLRRDAERERRRLNRERDISRRRRRYER